LTSLGDLPAGVDPAGLAVALCLGIALASAAGLRVFLPLLAFSAASALGFHTPGPPLEWLASPLAVVLLGVAAAVEVAAYYVPVLDNLLDTIAAPLAVVAGTMLVAAPLADLPPMLRWTAAVVAGGGAAGLTQGLTTLLRAKSTLLTGGAGNVAVSTGELGGALLLSVFALLLPVAAVALLVACLVWVLRRIRRSRPA
jgi:hypothetical protein